MGVRNLTYTRSPISRLFEDIPRMFNQAQKDKMIMQVNLLDKQIARKEKIYDEELASLDLLEANFLERTGEVFNLKDLDQSGNAEGVLEDMKGPIVDSYAYYLEALNEDIKEVKDNKAIINQQLGTVDKIENFYKGRAHDFTGGSDPERWDLQDFDDEAWENYIKDKPDLQDVEGYPYLVGVKSKQNQNKIQTIMDLNKTIDDARISKARAEIIEYEAGLKDVNIDQNNMRQMQIKGNLINMTYPKALEVGSGVLTEAITLLTNAEAAATDENTSKETEFRAAYDNEAQKIGAFINPFANPEEQNRLGDNLIKGSLSFVGTYDLKDLNKSNYAGWLDSMDEIYMTSLGFEDMASGNLPEGLQMAIDKGEATIEQVKEMYAAHKASVKELTGWEYNKFMNEAYPAIKHSEEKLEDFQIDQALIGLKQGVDSSFPSVSGVWDNPDTKLPQPVEGQRVTLEHYIQEYTPGDSAEIQNNYITKITQELGITRDTNLVDIDTSSLAQIQAEFEGWNKGPDTRNRRNNNPGNLKPSSLQTAQKWWGGVIGLDEDGFAIFDSPQSGWAALEQEIRVEKSRHVQVEDATMSQIGDISIDQLTSLGFSDDQAQNVEGIQDIIDIIKEKKAAAKIETSEAGWFRSIFDNDWVPPRVDAYGNPIEEEE